MEELAKVRAEIERLQKQIQESAVDGRITKEKAEAYRICVKLISFIDSMQEEPKKCMYTKDHYTDEDRKVLCEDCKEVCKYAKKEPVSEPLDIEIPFGRDSELIEETISIPDGCYATIKGNSVVIRKGKESVSEDLETEIEKIRKYHFINDDFDKTELDGRTISNIARHFANWQKRQMIKEAITGQLENGEDYLRIKCLYTSCRPQDDGKLVKFIIIK